MENAEIRTVTMIGAGNVATHLAKALVSAGKRINCVYSRTEEAAAKLASRVSAPAVTQTEDLPDDSDLYIIALPDSVVPQIIAELDLDDRLVVHTSGTLPAAILSDITSNYGVFYPFQTFSAARALDFRHVPVCIETPDTGIEKILSDLAYEISSSVHVVTAEKRSVLHVAGVFACNFTNMNYGIAEELLEKSGISFELIKPLIRETASKVMGMSPAAVQTGPAVREDHAVMQKHLELIGPNEKYAELYELMSELIILKKRENEQL